MLSPRWRKVLADLMHNKTRTMIVVLSIAVGVFAIGSVFTSGAILSDDLSDSYAAVNPAHAVIYAEPFDQALVDSIRSMREVGAAEGRRTVSVRVQAGPDQWRSLQLHAIPDFDDLQINKLEPESGAWPPAKRGMLLERSSLGYVSAAVGETVHIETSDGKYRELRIDGLTHDLTQIPAFWGGTLHGYITLDTLEWLGESATYNQLNIVVAENGSDHEHIRAVTRKIEEKMEKSGRNIGWTSVPEPGVHPMDQGVQAMLLLLGVLGAFSLLLSCFLVINTMNAIMLQQVRQIGIMKAIGARNPQITRMYLTTVIVFGLLALLVAVPLGALASRLMTGFVAELMNFDLAVFTIPAHVLLLEVAVGLIVPLLAALYPIIAGVRTTVREAVGSYGLGGGHFGTGIIDRMITGLRGPSRPLLLSLRNTFRRKGRLLFTLAALTIAGTIFISIMSVRDSTLLTTDEALDYFAYDIQIDFNDSYRVERIEREAMQVPGVVEAESWGGRSVQRIRDNEEESENYMMLAPPAESRLIKPTLVEGRWLLPEDENAVVINTDLLKDEPDIEVGDDIVLKLDGRETSWRVVGIVRAVLTGQIAYVNYPYYEHVARNVGRAQSVNIVTAQSDPAFQQEVAKQLEVRFKDSGLQIGYIDTTGNLRAMVKSQFNIIIVFLLIMAVLLAVVGGLGLMGTMGINVIERTREIGVMRAIGASDRAVMHVFLVEGMLIGIISWLIGAVLAVPVGKLLSDSVGILFTNNPFSYTFSTGGVFLWLGIVVVLSALASYLPARRATRLSVREVLAYE